MLQFLIDLFWILVWGVLSLIDLVFAIFFPNGRVHKLTSEIYHKHVKGFLTGDKMSRTSFSFAHGFFLMLLFGIVLSCVCYNVLFRERNDLVNKFIYITLASPTGDSIHYFDMNIQQDWLLENHNMDSLKSDFSFSFRPGCFTSDTAIYNVTVASNFEAAFTPDAKEALYVNIPDKSPKKTSFHVSFVNLPRENEIEIKHPEFALSSEVRIFNDEEYPYVNFYLEFKFNNDTILAPSENSGSGFHIWLNTKIDSLLMGDLPYDVVAIKPEPDRNKPYHIEYISAEKIREVIEKGIYISTVNRDLKAKKDRDEFLYSVMLGALTSFLLTIGIELLTKWRNLNQRAGRKNPYD